MKAIPTPVTIAACGVGCAIGYYGNRIPHIFVYIIGAVVGMVLGWFLGLDDGDQAR